MPAADRRRVAVLALPGDLALDLGIPVQAFGHDPRYQVTVRACLRSTAAKACPRITGRPRVTG